MLLVANCELQISLLTTDLVANNLIAGTRSHLHQPRQVNDLMEIDGALYDQEVRNVIPVIVEENHLYQRTVHLNVGHAASGVCLDWSNDRSSFMVGHSVMGVLSPVGILVLCQKCPL